MIDKEKIKKIRGNKKKCDWDRWSNDDHMMACMMFSDCIGCGAYKSVEEEMKDIMAELSKEHKESDKHIRDFLEQYDEGLIFDLLVYLLQEKLGRVNKNDI